jgi:hypothetical protein
MHVFVICFCFLSVLWPQENNLIEVSSVIIMEMVILVQMKNDNPQSWTIARSLAADSEYNSPMVDFISIRDFLSHIS